MDESTNPFSWGVWRRGGRLGLIWLALFITVTIVLFALMGITGWSGPVRALCAMIMGPAVGIGIIVGWWVLRRPVLTPDGEERK